MPLWNILWWPAWDPDAQRAGSSITYFLKRNGYYNITASDLNEIGK